MLKRRLLLSKVYVVRPSLGTIIIGRTLGAAGYRDHHKESDSLSKEI